MPFCQCPKWPMTRKCCFCIPVRKGVTIFAYANLIFNLLCLPNMIFVLVDHIIPSSGDGGTRNRTIALHTTTIVYTSLDVILIIILLVGVHKNNKNVLRTYFYLGVSFQLVTLCLDIILFASSIYEFNQQLVETLLYAFFFSLNVYQLFLVYNIIHMLNESKEVQYVVYQERMN